jgi:hypothetical protein
LGAEAAGEDLAEAAEDLGEAEVASEGEVDSEGEVGSGVAKDSVAGAEGLEVVEIGAEVGRE